MEQQEIDILGYWSVLRKNLNKIVLITFSCTLLAVIVSLIIPKTFKSQATLLPLGGAKGGGLSAAVAQMGLGGLLGGLSAGEGNSAQIMAILKSRTLAEKVIEKDDLMPTLFQGKWDSVGKHWKGKVPTMEDGVERLKTDVSFVEDKKLMIVSLSAEFRDPKIAQKVVNDYVRELYQHINANTFTTAKRNRIYIEGQLERNKTELLSGGKELASFYSANKVSNATPSVDVPVKPEDQSANGELVPLDEASLGDLQKQLDVVSQNLEQTKVVKAVPQQVYLQYMTLRQELLSKVNALLTQQYELAKVEENKEDLTFQVIDWGRLPVKKYKPKRVQIVITTFVMGLFLSIFYVFFKDYLSRVKESGSQA